MDQDVRSISAHVQGIHDTQPSAHHNPLIGVVVMLIASIIIGYYLTMTVILRANITDNRNKMYQALLMGFWMAFIELMMVGFIMGMWMPAYTYITMILVLGIALLTYLIYNQVGINENQFMLSMQEHHQMAIDMAKLVRPKVVDPDLMKIVDNIIQSQEREIRQMEEILDERGVPDDITSLFY